MILSSFVLLVMEKSCFSVRKSISTNERHVEHPFAGQNTQQQASEWPSNHISYFYATARYAQTVLVCDVDRPSQSSPFGCYESGKV